MDTTQALRDIRDAYESHGIIRNRLTGLTANQMFAAICEQFEYGHDSGRPDPHLPPPDDPVGPEWHTLEVANFARRLGIGILVTEYVENLQHDVWQPLAASKYPEAAERALSYLLENCTDSVGATTGEPVRHALRLLAGDLEKMFNAVRDTQLYWIGEYRRPQPLVLVNAATKSEPAVASLT